MNDATKFRSAENTRRWRARFKAAMKTAGYAGRSGEGLSPEGYRHRRDRGRPVPPWPTLVDARKSHKRSRARE